MRCGCTRGCMPKHLPIILGGGGDYPAEHKGFETLAVSGNHKGIRDLSSQDKVGPQFFR
jgi:hypothetical protein